MRSEVRLKLTSIDDGMLARNPDNSLALRSVTGLSLLSYSLDGVALFRSLRALVGLDSLTCLAVQPNMLTK